MRAAACLLFILLLSLVPQRGGASPDDASTWERAAEAVFGRSAERDCPAQVGDLATSADPRLRAASLLVVEKGARRLGLYRGGRLAMCTRIALGVGGPEGDKEREGDRRTPQGWYRSSDKPWSKFEGAIAVHYPNADDARAAQRAGRIDEATAKRIVRALRRGQKPPQNTALGGEILIHGGGSRWDWTAGCIALSDTDLAVLRAEMPADMATDILILP